jgi:hypothetical protein
MCFDENRRNDGDNHMLEKEIGLDLSRVHIFTESELTGGGRGRPEKSSGGENGNDKKKHIANLSNTKWLRSPRGAEIFLLNAVVTVEEQGNTTKKSQESERGAWLNGIFIVTTIFDDNC